MEVIWLNWEKDGERERQRWTKWKEGRDRADRREMRLENSLFSKLIHSVRDVEGYKRDNTQITLF